MKEERDGRLWGGEEEGSEEDDEEETEGAEGVWTVARRALGCFGFFSSLRSGLGALGAALSKATYIAGGERGRGRRDVVEPLPEDALVCVRFNAELGWPAETTGGD
jgi:hypothetical protein